MKLHGRNLIISVGGSAVAAARSCDIDVESETLEIASANSGQWREYIAGKKGWKVVVNHFIEATAGSSNPLSAKISMVGTTVTLHMEVYTPAGVIIGSAVTGTAICKQWKVTGTLGNICQGTLSFVGSGALS